MSGTHRRNWLSALALVVLAGCSSLTGNNSVLEGQWSGVATLPNGRTTHANLQQTGSAISGTLSIAGAFTRGRPITGQYKSSDRTFTWAVSDGCEVWGGVLNLSADGSEMTGPLLIDRSGCQPAQSNGSGNLKLTRQ